MKQLLLLRHAQAEEAHAGLADLDRPLSPRGRAEACAAAQCIALAGLRCDAIWVSPAVRTAQTAQIVLSELGLKLELAFQPAFYLGNPDALLAPLGHCASEVQALLLIGHNPGLSELAQRFNGDAPEIELRTSGLCLIRFAPAASWGNLRPQWVAGLQLLR